MEQLVRAFLLEELHGGITKRHSPAANLRVIVSAETTAVDPQGVCADSAA